jgi:hypothetical protein
MQQEWTRNPAWLKAQNGSRQQVFAAEAANWRMNEQAAPEIEPAQPKTRISDRGKTH